MNHSNCFYWWFIFNFVSLLLWFACSHGEDVPDDAVHIVYSGVHSPNAEDVALKLFITIQNTMVYPLHMVRGEMKKCCISPLSTQRVTRDCQIMSLMSEERIILHGREQANLTLVYPTLYPLGWIGDCDIVVRFGKKHSQQYSVVFQTESKDDTLAKKINSMFMKKPQCSSDDQEEMMDCLPVQCTAKYSGTRNYFNMSSQMCDKPVSCHSDHKFPLPTKAFDKRRNQCKDLQAKLHSRDVETIVQLDRPNRNTHKSAFFLYKPVCVNGHELPNGRGCICTEGWMTTPETYWEYGGPESGRMLELCGTRKRELTIVMKHVRNMYISIIVITLVALAIGLCVVVAYWYRRRKIKRPMCPPCSPIVYNLARVHTPMKPLLDGELNLHIGDIITDLQRTFDPGMWKGTCNGVVGIFPVSCAEFFTPNRTALHSID